MSRLEPLFAPRGIAVVGASRDPGKLGAVMLRSVDAVLRTADD
jgi:acetyltransferase